MRKSKPNPDDLRGLLALVLAELELEGEKARQAESVWSLIARPEQLPPSGYFRTWLILAGRGSGKTRTLAHRVAYRIAMGTDPTRILLLTFTRRAAAEMLRRVEGILRHLEAETRAERARSRGSSFFTWIR